MRGLRWGMAVLGLVLSLATCGDELPGPSNALLQMEKVAGDEQSDTVFATLQTPLRVKVIRGNTPVPGITVSWTVSSGALSAAVSVTDAAGIASVTWTLGAVVGEVSATASVPGALGSPITFVAAAAPAVIASDPGPGLVAGASDGASLGRASATDDVVYVSLSPGSIPDGLVATIHNPRNRSVVQQAVADGGFDPVAVPAGPGDVLSIDVVVTGGGPTVRFSRAVPPRRRPVVVRTDPPLRKRDVPLNASLVIVFSEPIEGSSLHAGSVQLRTGTTSVAGRLEVPDPGQLTATFVPDTPLDAATDYELSISQTVLDRDGDPLETPVSVTFTTASAPPLPASQLAFTVEPTNVLAGLSVTPSVRVTARDAAGNVAQGFAGTVSLTLATNPGGASLSGETTVTAGFGVATFADLRISEVGSGYTLRATASGLGAATSAPFDVTPAGRIAFASTRDGNSEIYVMNADGTGITRLTTDPGADSKPAWSPDGTRIAFVSTRDGNSEIYVMNADGSAITRLTNDAAFDGAPSWSPDGSRIAFVREIAPFILGIHVMNADGSGILRLTSGPWDSEPDWSPDGARIAFTHELLDDFTPASIQVMNADGSGVHALTSYLGGAALYAESSPAWSPDGTQIAFWSYGFGIARITSDGGDGTISLFTDGVVYGASPDWSPDGKKIVFLVAWEPADRPPGIYVINRDGTGPTPLLPANNFDPAWSPGSRP